MTRGHADIVDTPRAPARRHPAGQRSSGIVIRALQAAIAVLWIAGTVWCVAGTTEPAHYLPVLVPSFFTLAVLEVLIWRSWSGTMFDPVGLVLLSIIAFNGGQVLLEPFGLNEAGLLSGRFDDGILVQAILLVGCGTIAFLTGAICVSRPKGPPSRTSLTHPSEWALKRVGALLCAVALVPSVIGAREAVGVVMQGGYGALYQRDVGTGANAIGIVLSGFLLPGIFALVIATRRHTGSLVLPTVLLVTHALTMLFLGYRAHAVMPVLSFLWLLGAIGRPPPRTLLWSLAAMLVLVVFPAIRLMRAETGTERLNAGAWSRAYSDLGSPGVSTLSELGGTMRTVAYTLELVPRQREFALGETYLTAVLRVLPNVGSGVHKSVERGSPSAWLVQQVDPWQATVGGGLGFSMVAEAYLNFGWLGTPAVLFVVGLLLAAAARWSTAGDLTRAMVVASFLAPTMFWARGEFDGVVRPIVWYALVPWLLVGMFQRLRRSRGGLAPHSGGAH